MNIILWLVFGGLAGWIATIIVGQNARFGIIGNIVVGIIGAFLGGWLVDRLSGGRHEGERRPTSIRSFIAAIIGAIILLLIVNLIF